mmetsp:Transcript_76745/g.217142  ORF Transcript_76745/g.217142 Transcript_76745/m.217142 type:complete len:206 (-) Transcript_76745:244-861(-)
MMSTWSVQQPLVFPLIAEPAELVLQAVRQDHHEAAPRDKIRDGDRSGVADEAHDRRHDGPSDDAHDQQRGPDLRVVPAERLQGEAENRREHHAHEEGDGHHGADPDLAAHERAHDAQGARDRRVGAQQGGRGRVAQEDRCEEPAAHENHQREEHGVGRPLLLRPGQLGLHEADHEAPDADLRANIGKLRQQPMKECPCPPHPHCT